MAVYVMNPALGFPAPTHTLSPTAEAARQAVRRYAHERNLRRESESMVTRHGVPKFKAAPAAAEQFRSLAASKGFEVRVGLGIRVMNPGKANEYNAPAWTVAGMHRERNIAFRAVWINGRAAEGDWYDRTGAHEIGLAAVKDRMRAL